MSEMIENVGCDASVSDLHYLRSVLRHLREFRASLRATSIGAEVLADNIDWLDCFMATVEEQGREISRLRALHIETASQQDDTIGVLKRALQDIIARYDNGHEGWPIEDMCEIARRALKLSVL